jgi:hypothetical protein
MFARKAANVLRKKEDGHKIMKRRERWNDDHRGLLEKSIELELILVGELDLGRSQMCSCSCKRLCP